jgi:hypothetical protein
MGATLPSSSARLKRSGRRRKAVRSRRVLIAAPVVMLLGVLIAARVYRGYFGPPVITIVNASESVLSDIAVAGNGFRQSVSDLLPAGSRSFVIHPLGESGLKLACRLADRRIETDNLSYIEASGGYAVTITVRHDGHVECEYPPGNLNFNWRRAL